MEAYRRAFVLLCTVFMLARFHDSVFAPAAGAIVFTVKYQGQTVTGLVGSSVNFTWSFSGHVDMVTWGLKEDGINYIAANGALVSLDKSGSITLSGPPAYNGRVSGSLSGDSSSGQATFTLSSITRDDERSFGCQIDPADPLNDNSVFDPVQLVVHELPQISLSSVPPSYDEGSSVNISCTASGKPEPDVKWMKNTIMNSSGKRAAFLTFISIKRADDGLYICEANNSVGNDVSHVTLVVHYPATIQEAITSTVESWIGQTVTLKCVSDGVPSPTLTWYKPDGSQISSSTATEYTVNVKMSDDQDFGDYKCNANNGLTPADDKIVNIKQIIPDLPVEVTVQPLNSTAVVIQWKEPKSSSSPVKSYYVEVLEETFKDMFLISTSVTVEASVSTLAIGKLRPFTSYIARVAVQTEAWKRFSSEVFFTTAQNGRPEVQLHVLFTAENQVLLKWSLISRGNSVIQGYVIRYSLGAGSSWIKQLRISPSVMFYLLRDLKPSTTYYVELLATNEYFSSEPSVVEVTTQHSEQEVEIPKLPLPLPKRPSGFVYNDGQSSAPVHLSAFIDLTCYDSQQVWPVIKKLAKSYGPEKLRLTINFFALAYFNNAFISLKSAYVVASFNSSLVFPWVDTVFENRDYLKNSANTSAMNRVEIAEVIEQMADKAGIPSSVMKDGLTNKQLEWQSRLAWKYACSKSVMSTPTFFINDVFIAGYVSAYWSEEQWRGIINKMLPAE